jgi:hypothetical protein
MIERDFVSGAAFGPEKFETPATDVVYAIWSADGKSILYVAADGDFHLMRSDGTDAHKLANVGAYPTFISSM